jgi:hypothetical protein
MTAVDRVLASYCAPPGHFSLVPIRHDHNASLWRIDATRIELERYWEFERISGWKHHGLSLHDPARLADFIDDLLRGDGLTRADVSAVWGTPGIATGCPHVERFADTGLPVHSLAHLFSAIAVDTTILRQETIVGLAMDGGPDLLEDLATPRYCYAGCVSRAGAVDYVGVQSPARLWIEAGRKYEREPGTLMALASATTCAVGSDLPAMLAAASSYDVRFGLDDNVQSAVMKLVQQASTLVVMQEVQRLLTEHGVDPTQAYLAGSGGVRWPRSSRRTTWRTGSSVRAPRRTCSRSSASAPTAWPRCRRSRTWTARHGCRH